MPIQKELEDAETQTERTEVATAGHSLNEQAQHREDAAPTVNLDQRSKDIDDNSQNLSKEAGPQSSSPFLCLLSCIGQMLTREKGLCNSFFVL